MEKKIRVRLNQNDIEKKIQADTVRKFSYLIERKDSIEFILPPQNSLNHFLLHDQPLINVSEDGRLSKDGELGSPKHFYIPKSESESLRSLYKEFSMPVEIHDDLTTVFLSMVFASCTVTHTSNFHEEYTWKMKEFEKTFALLEQFEQDNLLLHAVTIEYKEKLSDHTRVKPSYVRPKFTKIKGHIAVQFLENILHNFKKIERISAYEGMLQSQKALVPFNPFMGHKNAEKQSQNYYASVILDYLRPKLFNPLFDLLSNPPEYQKLETKLRRIYSRRKLSLFIGKLMILSGLLKLKDDSNDEAIIDNLEKKLYPKFTSEKRRLSKIVENNKIVKDGRIEIIPFDKLF